MLKHRFMNVRFDLEIFFDPIPYKRTTFLELFSLKEFMFLKFAQWNILILPEYSHRVWICKLQYSQVTLHNATSSVLLIQNCKFFLSSSSSTTYT